MRKHFMVSLIICLCSIAGTIQAGGADSFRLSEFGKVDTVAGATKSMQRALETISGKGGGMLFITGRTTDAFTASSMLQTRLNAPAVTVIDIRHGKLLFSLPSLGFRLPEDPVGYASVFMNREINQEAINVNGDNTIMRLSNFVVKGTSSFFQAPLRTTIVSDEVRRVYSPTISGLYVGQVLSAMIGRGHRGNSGELSASFSMMVKVINLGWDNDQKCNFADLRRMNTKQKWGNVVRLFNKSTSSAMIIRDSIHSDSESPGSLYISKKAYAQGDCFGLGMHLKYMGNIMSTNGDEGGNGFSLDIWHMLDSFLGKVENWNPKTRVLTYTKDSIRANTLGTSRLMVNLNPEKWLTRGKVSIEANSSILSGAERNHGYVRGIGTKWSSAIIGRAIAIDEKDEYAGAGDGSFWKYGLRGRTVRRWWLIRHYEKNASGEERLWVERIRHNVYDRSTPTLINEANYRKPLKYIIAPCAMVNDVSRALLAEKKMMIKGASIMPGENDPRMIGLAPSPVENSKFDFAPGDPIEQAIGADPYHPNGYRVRHREAMPSQSGGASFLAQNNGAYPVFAAFEVVGAHDKMQIKQHSKFRHGLYVKGTTDYAVRISGASSRAAVMMENQPGVGAQKIIWRTGKRPDTELYADPENGALTVKSSTLALSGASLTETKGISRSAVAANNLRGINVKVPAGKKDVCVKFATAEKDSDYAVMVQASWLTLKAVSKKESGGFEVKFSTPAPPKATIDWILIR